MDEEPRRRVRNAILKHIETYPEASDTPKGIRQWWLPADVSNVEPRLLDEVLEEFVADGRMRRRRLPDGGVLYVSLPHDRRPGS